MQTFLTAQHESLEIIKAEEATRLASTSPSATGTAAASNIEESSNAASRSAVNEHIGPVQFNMGGIQVDAEDVLQRLADRSRRDDTPEPESGPGQARQGIAAALGGAAGDVRRGSGAGVSTPDGKSQNEALASFFANLMKRGGGSGVNSPRTPQQGQE
jgi:dynein light intermediate chain 1